MLIKTKQTLEDMALGGGKGQTYLSKDLRMELLMTTAGGCRLQAEEGAVAKILQGEHDDCLEVSNHRFLDSQKAKLFSQ